MILKDETFILPPEEVEEWIMYIGEKEILKEGAPEDIKEKFNEYRRKVWEQETAFEREGIL